MNASLKWLISQNVLLNLSVNNVFLTLGLAFVFKSFHSLGLGGCFCLLVKYSQDDTPWPVMSVLLIVLAVLKLSQNARGHFVRLIAIGRHLTTPFVILDILTHCW